MKICANSNKFNELIVALENFRSVLSELEPIISYNTNDETKQENLLKLNAKLNEYRTEGRMNLFLLESIENLTNCYNALEKYQNVDFRKEINENNAIVRDFLNTNIRTFNLPKRGTWSDIPGKSSFEISNDSIINVNHSKKQMTGKDLKEWMYKEFGVKTINYIDYDPDFYPFMDKKIGEISLRDCPDGMSLRVFAKNKAYMLMKDKGIDLNEYLQKKELTIHETGNNKAIAIPRVINYVFNHTGGDAIHKYISSLRSYIKQRLIGKKISIYKGSAINTSGTIDFNNYSLRKLLKRSKSNSKIDNSLK